MSPAADRRGVRAAPYHEVEEDDIQDQPSSRRWRRGIGLASSLLLLAAAALVTHREAWGGFSGNSEREAIIGEYEHWPCMGWALVGVEYSDVGNPGPGYEHIVYRIRSEMQLPGSDGSFLLSVSAPSQHVKFAATGHNNRKILTEYGKHVKVDFRFFYSNGTAAHVKDFRINVLDMDTGTQSSEYFKAYPDAFHAGSGVSAVENHLRHWPEPHQKWTFTAKHHGSTADNVPGDAHVMPGQLHDSVQLRYLDRHGFSITVGVNGGVRFDHDEAQKRHWRNLEWSIDETGTHCIEAPPTSKPAATSAPTTPEPAQVPTTSMPTQKPTTSAVADQTQHPQLVLGVDYIYVRQKPCEAIEDKIKSGEEITEDMSDQLVANRDLDDAEVVIPIYSRGLDDAPGKTPAAVAQAVIKARKYFETHYPEEAKPLTMAEAKQKQKDAKEKHIEAA